MSARIARIRNNIKKRMKKIKERQIKITNRSKIEYLAVKCFKRYSISV